MKRNGGFTLIEVLLAVLMVAFALVAILQGYTRIMEAYRRARFESDAAHLLQEKIAKTALDIKTGLNSTGTSQGKEGNLEWSVEIVPLPADGSFEIKAFVTPPAKDHKLEATTYVRQ